MENSKEAKASVNHADVREDMALSFSTFRPPVGPAEKFQMIIIRLQKMPIVGPVAKMIAKMRGVQIPPQTYLTPPYLPHIGPIIVHANTRIGKDVTLYHNVTIGRANIWEDPHSDFGGFEVGDHAVLCAGAVVLGVRKPVVVGTGTVIGANAVLTSSTGEWEIWAGAPARRIGWRNRPGA